MDINIRLAKPPDLETIIDIQTQSLSRLPDRFRKYDRRQIESLIVGQADARRSYILEETILIADNSDRRSIGFIAFARPLIVGLFVRPDFMNRGVGGRLLKELELLAIDKNIKNVEVMSSMESIYFYKQNGYQFDRDTGFFSTGDIWIPCKLLKKELIPSTLIVRMATQAFKILCQ
jgi:putative acetyltransferase